MSINAVMYTRVSTDEQAEHGYSLLSQKDKIEQLALRKGYTIVAHFQDDFSAKTLNRPEFNKLDKFVKDKSNAIEVILFDRVDRFTRNVTEGLQRANEYHNKGITFDFADGSEWYDPERPESLLLPLMMMGFAQIDNDKRSKLIREGLRRAKKEGRWVNQAPIGYKNERDTKGKPILVASDKAILVQEAFKEFAKGLINMDELRRKYKAKGLKLEKSSTKYFLTNVTYNGKIRIHAYKNEPELIVEGIHDAIIDDELFEKVQSIVNGKGLRKLNWGKKEDTFPLKSVLICSHCATIMTGSTSKGNGGLYSYYHCLKRGGDHAKMRVETLHKQVHQLIQSISLKKELVTILKEQIEVTASNKTKSSTAKLVKLKAQKEKLNTTIEDLHHKLYTGALPEKAYASLLGKFEAELTTIETELKELGKPIIKTNKNDLKNGLLALTQLENYYLNSNNQQVRQLFGSIFPKKLEISKQEVRTIELSPLFQKIALINNTLENKVQKKSRHFDGISDVVVIAGIEPATQGFSVLCSTN